MRGGPRVDLPPFLYFSNALVKNVISLKSVRIIESKRGEMKGNGTEISAVTVWRALTRVERWTSEFEFNSTELNFVFTVPNRQSRNKQNELTS